MIQQNPQQIPMLQLAYQVIQYSVNTECTH